MPQRHPRQPCNPLHLIISRGDSQDTNRRHTPDVRKTRRKGDPRCRTRIHRILQPSNPGRHGIARSRGSGQTCQWHTGFLEDLGAVEGRGAEGVVDDGQDEGEVSLLNGDVKGHIGQVGGDGGVDVGGIGLVVFDWGAVFFRHGLVGI